MLGGLGRHLAGEVDGVGHVHGNHAVVLGDDEGVVHIVRRPEINPRVVVEKLVQVLAADGAGSDQFAFVEPFPAVGDHSRGIQVHHVIGDVLGVKPQIVLVGQGLDRCLGGGVQADLERGAVIHEAGNVFADPFGRPGSLAQVDGQNGFFVLHQHMHIVDVNEALPHGAGHSSDSPGR